ncbi:hypothetical protein [Conexibacter sp. S30A1]|uniref:hypothetical protein n=1 Tax=Conexibacter sp. S30A1 TaxID=2937800 RepID=UPI002010B22D|nr:hypothetical protein [Conexibacter sp. S30A1]
MAEASCGHLAFVEQALARLDAGQAEYGDSWAWIGVRRHVAELAEEAADLGAWSALADQALDHEHALGTDERERVRQVLRRVASLGAASHRLLTEAAAELERP